MPRRNPAKERYWRRLLGQWRQSGLTPRAFCVEQGVNEASFYSWRREIAWRDRPRTVAEPSPRARCMQTTSAASLPSAGAAAAAFVKLRIDPGAGLASAIDVVVAEGRLLRVRPGFDADLLRQLVRLLEEPSC